jgi:hypothetical protein
MLSKILENVIFVLIIFFVLLFVAGFWSYSILLYGRLPKPPPKP